MSNKSFKIFVDFDGTITTRDVGEAMFLEFGDPDKAIEIVNDWINEKINASTSWELLCNTIKDFNEQKFSIFLNTIKLDSGFKDFVKFCNINNFEINILSDGLDYYIKKILNKENFNHLNAYTNKLTFTDEKKLIPNFPYTDEECTKCANCKRNHILNHSSEEDFSVYIGDGWSDTCPAQYCDFVFAKNSLLKFCEKNRVTFFPFSDFHDVIKKLDQLKEKKRLKKRHQALLKRKEVFAQG